MKLCAEEKKTGPIRLTIPLTSDYDSRVNQARF